MIINSFFLQHIHISLDSSGYINVFQWNWECFLFWHIELNSRFNVMTTDEVTFDWPEVILGFSVLPCSCRLRPFRVALKFFSEIFTPCRLSPPKSGFSDSSRMDFWWVKIVQLLNVCNHNVSFPKLSPRLMHSRGIFQVKLSCQIGSFAETGWYSTIAPNGITGA